MWPCKHISHIQVLLTLLTTSGYSWRSDTIHSCLQARDAAFGSQDLGFRTSINGHWVSLSRPGFQNLDIWLSRPGFQDLDKQTLSFTFRTWVSEPRYLVLRTWVSGPWQTHRYRTPKALHPTVVLSFSRLFSLRPPSLFSTSSGHRRTHAQTDARNKWLYI
jgi:hypothetical protein